LRKKSFSRRSVTTAAKAGAENKPVVAAVNRCATQKQAQTRLLPQAAKRYPDMKVEDPKLKTCESLVFSNLSEGADQNVLNWKSTLTRIERLALLPHLL
jgi:hypothetical protein